jgi:hypothetical protein
MAWLSPAAKSDFSGQSPSLASRALTDFVFTACAHCPAVLKSGPPEFNSDYTQVLRTHLLPCPEYCARAKVGRCRLNLSNPS